MNQPLTYRCGNRAREMAVVVFRVRGEFHAGRVHRCFTDNRNSGVIDLSRMSWTDPGGLVAVAVVAEALVRDGATVTVKTPADRERRNYLDRMRLGWVLDDIGAGHDFTGVREHRPRNALLEVQRFEGTDQPNGLAQMVYETLAVTDEGLAVAMHQSIVEIGINVPEHSGLTHGYIAAQTTRDNRLVQFAIADSGRGFAAGLRARGVATEADALARVLGPSGLSSRAHSSGGFGIPTTRRLLTERGGHMSIVSTDGSAIASADGGIDVKTQGLAFPGTLIQGVLMV